jgi:hypothetical protein
MNGSNAIACWTSSGDRLAVFGVNSRLDARSRQACGWLLTSDEMSAVPAMATTATVRRRQEYNFGCIHLALGSGASSLWLHERLAGKVVRVKFGYPWVHFG